MINDLNFGDVIEEATGKTLGVHWGLVAGTFSAYGMGKGLSSAALIQGFEVWKKTETGYDKIQVKEPKTIEENAKLIIEWLKK